MNDFPSRLGRYEIVGILGQGAMGVVYEGFDSVIERRVAIKTIRSADLDPEDDPEPLRRFMIEARAAGKLNHPHIVGLYDHGDDAGQVYLVMELVSGRELQRHIESGVRFGYADTLRLMGELLSALGYSHRQGVVHRDVKPANIFITEEGSVKLGDFGIARIEATQRTRVGTLLGTPSHMAPEQIRGEAADARSDLYAAGVVLYELLAGRRPFTGPMLKLAMKVLNEEPPAPSTFAPDLPPEVDAVVLRALAKAPAERYQSAVEFWQALVTALGPLAATGQPGQQATGATPGIGTWSSGFATQGFGTLPRATASSASAAHGPSTAARATVPPTGAAAVAAGPIALSTFTSKAAPVSAPAREPGPAQPLAAAATATSEAATAFEPASVAAPAPAPAPGEPAHAPAPAPAQAAAAATATAAALAPATPAARMPARTSVKRPPESGNRLLLVGATVGLLLLLAVGWLMLGREAPPDERQTANEPSLATRPAPAGPEQRNEPGAPAAVPNATAPPDPPPPAPSPAPIPRQPVQTAIQPAATEPVPAASPPVPRGSTAGAPSAAPTAAPTRTAAAVPARREPPRSGPAIEPAEAAPPVPAATAQAPKPARCSDILLKASLEPLSDEEGSFLRRECR